MRVLGIDDNEQINKMLEDVLIPLGFEYASVNNGKEGLKLILKEQWDVVLLDLAMPKYSGKDLLLDLAKIRNLKKPKIVVFTASLISDNEVKDLKNFGVTDFLKKPVSFETLVKTLSNLEKN